MKERHCILSIFGATGDLTNRKLLPALYYLEQEKYLKEKFKVVAIARKEKTSEEYRKEASKSIMGYSKRKVSNEILQKLISRIYYHQLEISDQDDYIKLKKFIENLSGDKCSDSERIFYLAVPSSFFGIIINNLRTIKLAEKNHNTNAYNRVVFEKPFGHDLNSARELNESIIRVFDENQIYRIDHYMAKELVQNLIILRFANSIFEPLWNKNYIDYIQITVAESIGVEGRGEYYEKAGAIRDVMQNHMMQLLTLVAMEAPNSLSADELSKEKVKVLKSISKFTKSEAKKIAVIGQYTAGLIDNKKAISYIDEPEISKESKTDTFAVLKLEIDNTMWKGVPFYLRTGKRLKERATEIVIVYKKENSKLFKKLDSNNNMMVIRVDPYEGITLQFNAKVPGTKVVIDDVTMDFCHECKFGINSPEAYERLLYDVMAGDRTLFTSWDEVENAWRIFDVLIKAFKNTKPVKYEAGSWGPSEAFKLIEKDARKWVEPTKPAYADLIPK